MAGTPLRYEGKVVGALTVGSVTSKSIDASDRSLIGYMANQITTAIVKARLYEDERDARMKLGALENISEAALTTLSTDDLLNEIADRMIASLQASWGAVVVLGNSSGQMVVEYASSSCANTKGQSLSVNCPLADNILANGAVKVLKRSEFVSGGMIFLDADVKLVAMLPVTLRQNRVCLVVLGKKENCSFSKKEIDLITTLGSRAALALENSLLFNKLECAYLEIIESLVKAVEAKDEYTCGHSEEVAAIAKAIALTMGMGVEQAAQIFVAGLLHDVGKIGITSSILCKPTRLTQAEYDEIKLHTTKGYQILKPVGGLKYLAEAVLQHHERFDGAGYPNGLSGEDILIEARILAVADAFQAMTSNRPYRKGLPYDKAIAEIKKGVGSQFDPEVARVFISMLENGEFGKTGYENVRSKLAG